MTELKQQQEKKLGGDSSLPTATPRQAPAFINKRNIAKWSIETTAKWLATAGYEDCIPYFQKHKINGRALLMLNEDDLKEIITHNVGQRKK